MSLNLCPDITSRLTHHSLRILFWRSSVFFALLVAISAHSQTIPSSSHVVLVIEENQQFTTVQSQMSWLTARGNQYGYAANYQADTSGSLMDYLWLSSGSCEASSCAPSSVPPGSGNFNCSGDNCGTRNPDGSVTPVPGIITDNNIYRILDNAGLSWKLYAESIPSTGYTGDSAYPYVRRHNPAVWYSVINTDGSKVIDFTNNFANDLANGTLPNYSVVIPNMQDDAHDGTPAQADTWLQNNIAPLLNTPAFQAGGDGLLIITFDECDAAAGGNCSSGLEHIYTAVIGPKVVPHTVSNVLYKHENTLKTILEALGQTTFPLASGSAAPMCDFFNTCSGTVSWSPSSQDFGSENLNTTSPAHTLTLSNTTASAISGLSIGISGDFAIQSNNCGSSLGAGANCSVNVTFTPTVSGARSGTLTATYTGGSASAGLTGTGVSPGTDLADNFSGCTGSCSTASEDTSIQLDGAGTKLTYNGGAAYGNGTWSQTLASSYNNFTQFSLDFWAYMNNPGLSQAFEIHTLQHTGTQFYPFMIQCDFKGSGFWRVWDPQAGNWVSTGIGCAVFTANSWNHFTVNFQRANNQLDYENIVINGTTYAFNTFTNPLNDTSPASVALEARLVGDSVSDAYSVWLDETTLSQPSFSGVQNIDDQTFTCTGNCSSSADTTTQLDGSAAKFQYTGGAAYSSATFTTPLSGSWSNATSFALDFRSFITQPTLSQALEVHAFQQVNGNFYPFKVQCDFKGSKMWRVYNPPSDSWVSTGVGCVVFTANSWDHFILHFHRSGTQLVYQDIVINGVTYSFGNITVNALAQNNPDSMKVETELGGDSSGQAYAWWIDEMSLTF